MLFYLVVVSIPFYSIFIVAYKNGIMLFYLVLG